MQRRMRRKRRMGTLRTLPSEARGALLTRAWCQLIGRAWGCLPGVACLAPGVARQRGELCEACWGGGVPRFSAAAAPTPPPSFPPASSLWAFATLGEFQDCACCLPCLDHRSIGRLGLVVLSRVRGIPPRAPTNALRRPVPQATIPAMQCWPPSPRRCLPSSRSSRPRT